MEFKKYKRTQIAEMRPVLTEESTTGELWVESEDIHVSISTEDILGGSPRLGDMVARNPKNHRDQWLVSQKYFMANFGEYDENEGA